MITKFPIRKETNAAGLIIPRLLQLAPVTISPGLPYAFDGIYAYDAWLKCV